ncbi:MAG: dTDP-glucose 4,6-dehydratase [Candidatus Marinimicrobia bacterium]|nr:dTDP-glucose 4,6-dehydratase [Candidatus Neomarinimicrobiota bacterium]
MKTILITGGAGFIGSNFVKYIYKNYPDYRILVLDALTYAGNPDNLSEEIKKNNRFEFWYGDVQNSEIVNALVQQSDVVVHFAAETHVARSIYNNKQFYMTDVLGTHTITNAVLKNQKTIERFIHISTSEVYGTAEQWPMSEEHPLKPRSPYASAKTGADRLVYSYYTTYDLPVVIVRPFNNYGPSQHLEKVIPRFIANAMLDEPLTIHGDGSSKRDWIYVEDHCEALDKIIHADIDLVKGEVFNLGTGRSIDVLTIARMVLDELGKPESLIKYLNDRPGQVVEHIADTSKAEKILDWKYKTEFEDGLKKTIQWSQENQEMWKELLWMRTIPIVTASGEVQEH